MKTLTKFMFTAVFAAIFLCSSFSFAASKSANEVDSAYRIGPQNVLVVNVFFGRDKDMERKVRVSSKGVINFPLLGEVVVENLTISELESKLTSLLGKDYLVNPQVSVFIEEYSTVSILGQVEEPGNYEIKGKLTVVELISKAGGFTKIAHTNNVWVIRTNKDGSKTKMHVKVNDIINHGKEEEDIQLYPGDIVTVSESFF